MDCTILQTKHKFSVDITYATVSSDKYRRMCLFAYPLKRLIRALSEALSELYQSFIRSFIRKGCSKGKLSISVTQSQHLIDRCHLRDDHASVTPYIGMEFSCYKYCILRCFAYVNFFPYSQFVWPNWCTWFSITLAETSKFFPSFMADFGLPVRRPNLRCKQSIYPILIIFADRIFKIRIEAKSKYLRI